MARLLPCPRVRMLTVPRLRQGPRGFLQGPVFVRSSLTGAGPVQPAGLSLRLPSLGASVPFPRVESPRISGLCWSDWASWGHPASPDLWTFCHKHGWPMPTSRHCCVARCGLLAGHLGPLHAAALARTTWLGPGSRGSRPQDCPSRSPSLQTQAAVLLSRSSLLSQQPLCSSLSLGPSRASFVRGFHCRLSGSRKGADPALLVLSLSPADTGPQPREGLLSAEHTAFG